MGRHILEEEYLFKGVREIVEESLRSKEEGKVLLIVGEPGSGKSVFMRQLYDQLERKAIYLTAIDAACLKEIDSPKEICGLFERIKLEEKPKVLILDSLDILAYSRRLELHEWLSCVDKLKKIKNMTVICASRSFEAEHLYPMNKEEWSQKQSMEPFPDEFIEKIFKKLDYNFDNITVEMLEFLKSPIHLKIAADIIKNGGDIKYILSLQELYNRLCEVLDLSDKECQILISLAKLMIKDRTAHLAYSLISLQLTQELKALEKSGIWGLIQIDERNQKVSFCHQTLIDYFSALRVLREDETIKNFVLNNNQSLFIRPVIRHILLLLRIQSKKTLFEQLNEVFNDNGKKGKIGFANETTPIRMHIKTAVMTNLASWKNPTMDEARFILNLFKHRKDGQTIAVEFFKGIPCADWFDVLKDNYIYPILKDRDSSNLEYRLILSFLERIVPDKTANILDICFMLLEKKNDSQLEFFFNGIAEKIYKSNLETAIIERYVRFLELIVRETIVKWDFSIERILRMLSKYNPEKSLNLYHDILLDHFKGKVFQSSNGITQTFEAVVPPLFKIIPFQVLKQFTNFFENIFSEGNSSRPILLDSPTMRLYSNFQEKFDIDGIYDWFKDRVLDFCSKLHEDSKAIIQELERSKWETQKQLAILCKIQNADIFKKEILQFIDQILMSDLTNQSMYKEPELFLRAIEVIFPHISQKTQDAIVDNIIKLKLEDKFLVRDWIWKPLHHIPRHFHNNKIKERIRQLRKNYDFEEEYKYTPPIFSTGVQAARSPKSKEELSALEPDDLFNFLIENNELESNWDSEANKFFGGVALLSREVGSLFVEDFDRYRSIVGKLSRDEKNDIYIKRFFSALQERRITEDKFDFAIELILGIYPRDDIQLEIIRFLEKNVSLITENNLNKLKDVLLALSEAPDPEEDKFFEYRKQGYSNDAITEGINSVRGDLAQLCILILKRFAENFLIEILDKLSKDKTISVRAALVDYLPYSIETLGWEKAFRIFSNAFEKGPEEYAEFITKFLIYTPKENIESLKEILDKMWKKRASALGKAYAEVVTILYFRGLYPEKGLIEMMSDETLIKEGKEESFRILVNQLEFKENVNKALKVISNLAEFESTTSIDWDFMFMKAKPEDFYKITPIILKIIANSKLWGRRGLYHMLEYLEKSLLIDPSIVFELLEEMILRVNENIWEDDNLRWISHSKAPLNIINTIFECFPEEEDRAMIVLDRLIELNWSGVDDYLHSLDRI